MTGYSRWRRVILSTVVAVFAALEVACGGNDTKQASPVAPSCVFAALPTSATLPANGGDGSFDVTTTPADCSWTTTVSFPFEESLAVRIISGSSGQGNGQVKYQVDPNDSQAQRTNDIVVSGLSQSVRHTVTQLAPTSSGCTFSLASSSSLSFGPNGGTGNVTVNASGPTCGWSLDISATTEDWVHVVHSGIVVGSGSATFTVSSASSMPSVPLPRSGPLFVYDVAGNEKLTITVKQQ